MKAGESWAKRYPLILASASPRRAELLQQAGLEFQILPAATSEVHPEHLTPPETCQINAYRKARAIAKKRPDALVLGAGTIGFLGRKVFGRPDDPEETRDLF